MADEKDLDLSAEEGQEEPVAEESLESAGSDSDLEADQAADIESALGGDEPLDPDADVEAEVDAALNADLSSESLGGGLGEEDMSKIINDDDVPEDEAEAAMLKMLEDLPDDEGGMTPDDINFGDAQVSKAEFQQLSGQPNDNEKRNINLLMDVNLPISIELGRTRMSISEILQLGPGSVVELNKLAGEPVDLLVNYKIVAKGEVVVIDENFGVRITQLITPEERLKILGDQ